MRALIVLAFLCSACPGGAVIAPDAGAPIGDAAVTTPVFQPCTQLCRRPGDCQLAYPSDGLCPPGFLCTRSFTCVSDGGARD